MKTKRLTPAFVSIIIIIAMFTGIMSLNTSAALYFTGQKKSFIVQYVITQDTSDFNASFYCDTGTVCSVKVYNNGEYALAESKYWTVSNKVFELGNKTKISLPKGATVEVAVNTSTSVTENPICYNLAYYGYTLAGPGKVGLLGDVDLNGEVDTFDAALLTKFLGNQVTFNADQLLAANTFFDNKVNVQDLLDIDRFIQGKISSFR